MANPIIGETVICKWKEGKTAAFSVGGDDSLRSQLFFAIPEMDKHGIRGTWWVNPGRGGKKNFKNKDDDWANCWIACCEDWKAAAHRGHDFANHTLHHLGVTDYNHADFEIGETARIIWASNPGQRLQLFDKGGGTTWNITEHELDEILNKYDCIQGRGGGTEDPTWQINPSADTLRAYVDDAIREGSWHHVAFHGVGPNCEWGGPMDGSTFIALLDYLVEKRDLVWTGTHTEVHKYDQERASANVKIINASDDQIHLNLISSKEPGLYNYPLTLRTNIPEHWQRIQVKQAEELINHLVSESIIQFEAIPGNGDIKILCA